MVPIDREVPKTERRRSPEAQAIERVAGAAREVQAASAALERQYCEHDAQQPSLLELVRFSAAMQELKDAREAFDLLVAGDCRLDSSAVALCPDLSELRTPASDEICALRARVVPAAQQTSQPRAKPPPGGDDDRSSLEMSPAI